MARPQRHLMLLKLRAIAQEAERLEIEAAHGSRTRGTIADLEDLRYNFHAYQRYAPTIVLPGERLARTVRAVSYCWATRLIRGRWLSFIRVNNGDNNHPLFTRIAWYDTKREAKEAAYKRWRQRVLE